MAPHPPRPCPLLPDQAEAPQARTGPNLWYTRRGRRICGPYPAGQVQRYVLLGRITDIDELSQDCEHWQFLRDLPELVPDVMKDVQTPEDYQRLVLARAREDERQSVERRGEGDGRHGIDRRWRGERRQPEDPVLVARRERRARAQSSTEAGNRRGPLALAGIVVAALAAVLAWQAPRQAMPTADCQAAPTSGVSWEGCRLPGLEAEGVNLAGTRARSADLTGAQLAHSRWPEADLAYARLNLADLRQADLSRVQLQGASMRFADLRGARLLAADLSYADLSGARIDQADLSNARLDRAIWTDGSVCADGSVGACISAQPK